MDNTPPNVQRPRADQVVVNAAQAVVPQVEPPPAPAAEPALAAPQPLAPDAPNPPAEQLEVFLSVIPVSYLMFAGTRFYRLRPFIFS